MLMNRYFATFVLCILTAACQGQATPDEPVATSSAAIVQAPATQSVATASAPTLGTFEAYWPQRTAAEMTQRMTAVASVMLGAPSLSSAALQTIATAHASGTSRWSENVVLQGSHVHIEYYPSKDDLRIHNMDTEASMDTSTDIGEAAARNIVDGALTSLNTAGIIDSSLYDLSKAEVSYTQKGEGGRRIELCHKSYSIAFG